jgi:hypothetical protein
MFVTSWCHCVYGVRREPRELIGAAVPQRGVRGRGGGAQARARAGRGPRGSPTRQEAGPGPGEPPAPAQPARRRHKLAVRSPGRGPMPGPRSRSAVGPVHPSWAVPDLVPHSCTKQVCVCLGAAAQRRFNLPRSNRRPDPPLEEEPQPRRVVSRMYRNSGVAL